MIEQFTYTGSPWGFTAPGWTVFQFSDGLNPRLADAYRPYYKLTAVQTGDSGFLPVRLVYVKDKATGTRILSQSLDAGPRWYDPIRGHDYFAHVFVAPIDSGMRNLPSDFNPFAWIRSEAFQTAFPDEFKEKALKILKGDTPNEQTPRLQTLSAWNEIPPNENYSDACLLDRIGDGAIKKLGRLCYALIFRKRGGTLGTVMFDANSETALCFIALAVRLVPLSLRSDISFSTWIEPAGISSFPNNGELDILGTCNIDKIVDPDVGVYGFDSLPDGGLKFETTEEVELFKDMLDACGLMLDENGYDDLILCWEVATGRKCSVEEMRTANQFCMGGSDNHLRFPELHTLLLDKIAAKISENVNTNDVEWLNRFATARFEIGAEPDEYASDQFLEACVMDRVAFNSACQCVRTDPSALRLFLRELECAASSKEYKENLAERLLETNMITREDVIAVEDKLPFINLIFKYREIVKRGADQVNASADDIKVVEELKGKFGISLSGMDDVLGTLKYKYALLKITSIGDIAKCLKSPFPRQVDLKGDILSRVKPSSPQEKVKLARAFDASGISGEEYVVEEWDADVRSRDEMSNALNDSQRKLEKKARENVKLRRRPGIVGVICILLGGIVIGWVGGWMFKPDVRGGKSAQSKNSNPPIVVVTTQKTDAVSLQQGGPGRVEPKDKRKQTSEPAKPSSVSEPSSVTLTPVKTPRPAPEALGTHSKTQGGKGKESKSTAPIVSKPSADDGQKIQPESPKHDEFGPTQEVQHVSEPLQGQNGRSSVISGGPGVRRGAVSVYR